jgi:hypothetical protein
VDSPLSIITDSQFLGIWNMNNSTKIRKNPKSLLWRSYWDQDKSFNEKRRQGVKPRWTVPLTIVPNVTVKKKNKTVRVFHNAFLSIHTKNNYFLLPAKEKIFLRTARVLLSLLHKTDDVDSR